MEPIPLFLQAAFQAVTDGTKEGDTILRHMAQLDQLPEDGALRLAYVGVLFSDDPVSWCAAGWARLHRAEQEGGQAA